MKVFKVLILISIILFFLGVNILADPADLIVCNEPLGGGIWTINSDGTNLTEISDFGWFAKFSSGGEKIVFGKHYLDGIWVMDSDGSNRINIHPTGGNPSWSPDRSQIVFVTGDATVANRRIWIVNADGTGLRLLVDRPSDFPEWSNYGNKIVFNTYWDGIWVINADGTGDTQILPYGFKPSWSPDDSQIVFYNQYIYTMDADGSNVTQVSTSIGACPSMGPDGRIVFESAGGDIILLDPDTSIETLLVKDRLSPDWAVGEPGLPYSLGMVFSGVGLIPFSEIVDGLATTDPSYYLPVKNAPFGGKMHIFGNFEVARKYNVAKYKIIAAKWPNPTTEPDPSDFEDIVESWGNYLWNPVTEEYDYYITGSDSQNKYTVPPASENWYLDDLLIEWDSSSYPDGKYSLAMRAYRPNGTELTIPINFNRLVLQMDNTKPTVKIDEVKYGSMTIDACAIVEMASTDVLEFLITAEDTEGYLYNYKLRGLYGENQQLPANIAYDAYTIGIKPDSWTGINSLSDPSFFYSPWPQSCAYNFRLEAWGRSTNGYRKIHYSEYNIHMTLLLTDLGDY